MSEVNHNKDDASGESPYGDYLGVGIAIGIGVGTAFGVAMDNIGMGIGIGVALGPAFALIFKAAADRRRSEEYRSKLD